MIYFDTSFLVPLILPEATSAEVALRMREMPAGQLAVSHWARVEFSSLIARQVRMGGLDETTAKKADARFETMIEESFVLWLPNADDFALAKLFLGNFATGLRAGDALHLAIARNREASAVYSLDKVFLRAGEMLGVTVKAIE